MSIHVWFLSGAMRQWFKIFNSFINHNNFSPRHHRIFSNMDADGCSNMQHLWLSSLEVWQAAPSLLALPIRCRGTWRAKRPGNPSSCWRRVRFKVEAPFLWRCLRFLFRYISIYFDIFRCVSCTTWMHSGFQGGLKELLFARRHWTRVNSEAN